MDWKEDLASLFEQIEEVHVTDDRTAFEHAVQFAFCAVDFYAEHGHMLRGYSFKRDLWQYLLVVKTVYEGRAYVSFYTGKTPENCMSLAIRKLEEDRVNWQVDRFA